MKDVCKVCLSKANYFPNADTRKITREEHDFARQIARDSANTHDYQNSMKLRKMVDALFEHLSASSAWHGSDRADNAAQTTNSTSRPLHIASTDWPRSFTNRGNAQSQIRKAMAFRPARHFLRSQHSIFRQKRLMANLCYWKATYA